MVIPINDVDPRIQYVGSGGETDFTFPFVINEESHLIVEKTDTLNATSTLVLNTDYTIDDGSVDNANGGGIKLTTALVLNEVITITRDVPEERLNDFLVGGDLTADDLNNILDLLVQMIQEQKSRTNRAVTLQNADPSSNVQLPTQANRADRLLGFDSNGAAIPVAALLGTITATPFAETVLAQSSAGSWLDTLGFSTYVQGLKAVADQPTLLNTLNVPNLANVSGLYNVSLAASVASNQLTVSAKTLAGNDASSTDKGYISFRSATATSGAREVIELNSALSATLNASDDLGFPNNTRGYVYVYALNNAGTIELAIARQAIFDEGALHSTTALGGPSTANNVLYSAVARSNVPVKLLGKILIQHGAGIWSNAPDIVTTWSTEMKKTNDVVQRIVNNSYDQTNWVTADGVIPRDDTIPQITEGRQYASTIITPQSAYNELNIQASFTAGCAAAQFVMLALFEASNASALASDQMVIGSGNWQERMELFYNYIPGDASQKTFSLRFSGTASLVRPNRSQDTIDLGGTISSPMIIKEIHP